MRQDLQCGSLPFLFSPHPSVLQSLNLFSPMKHSEQVSLCVDRVTPHPQLAASKTYSFSTSAVAHDRQCVLGNIPLHAGHSGIDPGAGTTNVDAAILPHFTHKGWSAFFGWWTTRYGCSMACRASATCSSSGHVPSAAVGEGLTTPTVILPMSRLIRVSLSSWVPAAAASASAARVLLLVLPAPQPQLMVVWCVVCVVRCVCEEGASEVWS